MPAKTIKFDASGFGQINFAHRLKRLTIQNTAGTLVKFRTNLWTDPITLAASTMVEFEPEEAREVDQLIFTNGAANGSVEVIWV